MSKQKKKQAKPRKFNKKNWIISQLRRLSIKYPPSIRARNRTKEEYYILSKKGKQLKRVKFTCEKCQKIDLKRTETELDHIIPCVSVNDYKELIEEIKINNELLNILKCDEDEFKELFSLMIFMARLFVDEDGYQLLCQKCHKVKTKKENAIRRKSKCIK